MKIVLFTLFCLILIGMTSYSYAEFIVVNKTTVLPEVMLQLELRDSKGNLLTYVESEQIIGISPLELNRYLDKQNQTSAEFLIREFFIKDDKNYESQQWEIAGVTFDRKHAYSATRLLDVHQNEFVTLLLIRHDSYQTQPGDTLRIFWTVIRPVS